MTYFHNRTEKDKIRGKDLKALVEGNTSVIVCNGNRLYGVNAEDFYINVLKEVPTMCEKKIVFVSNQLSDLSQLEDYDEYTIKFVKNGLEVWRKNPKNPADLVIFISGITV